MYIDKDKRGVLSIMEITEAEADLIAAALSDLGYRRLTSQLKSIKHEFSTPNTSRSQLDFGPSRKNI